MTTTQANEWVVNVVATAQNTTATTSTASWVLRASGASYTNATENLSLGVADIPKAAAGAQTAPTWTGGTNNTTDWVGVSIGLRRAP